MSATTGFEVRGQSYRLFISDDTDRFYIPEMVITVPVGAGGAWCPCGCNHIHLYSGSAQFYGEAYYLLLEGDGFFAVRGTE